MNLTCLLDVLILLFFAQAIYNQDCCDQATADARKANAATVEMAGRVHDLESARGDAENRLKTERAQNATLRQALERSQKTLEDLRREIHLVEENLDFEQLRKRLHLPENASNEEVTKALIQDLQRQTGVIQTQASIQKQTQKEIAVWTFVLESSPTGPSLRLYINGVEKDLTKGEQSAWKFPEDSRKWEDRLLKILCDKDVIDDADIKNTNLVLWFTSKQKRTLGIDAKRFAGLFTDTVMRMAEIYKAAQTVETPLGRGKTGIHVIAIGSDPQSPDISLDPSLLEDSQVRDYTESAQE